MQSFKTIQALVQVANFAHFLTEEHGFHFFCGEVKNGELVVNTFAGQQTAFTLGDDISFDQEGGIVLPAFPYHHGTLMRKSAAEPGDWLAMLDEPHQHGRTLILTIGEHSYCFCECVNDDKEPVYFFDSFSPAGAGVKPYNMRYDHHLFIEEHNEMEPTVMIAQCDLKKLLANRDAEEQCMIPLIVDGDGTTMGHQIPVQCYVAEALHLDGDLRKRRQSPRFPWSEAEAAFTDGADVEPWITTLHAGIDRRHHDILHAIMRFVDNHPRTEHTKRHYQFIHIRLLKERLAPVSEAPLWQTGLVPDYILRSFDDLTDKQCLDFARHAMIFHNNGVETMDLWEKWATLTSLAEKALKNERYTLISGLADLLSEVGFADGPVLKAYILANGLDGDVDLDAAYRYQVLATEKMYLYGYGNTMIGLLPGGLFAHALFHGGDDDWVHSNEDEGNDEICREDADGNTYFVPPMARLYAQQITDSKSIVGDTADNISGRMMVMLEFDIGGRLIDVE